MYVYGSSHVHTAQPISAPHRPMTAQAPQARGSVSGVDQLDISPEADLISQAHNLPDIRQDKVNDIRAQIAAGTYDTDAKLEAALSRFMDEIG